MRATALGVTGAAEFLDPELASLAGIQPARDGRSRRICIAVCDEATQAVYDQIWTNLKN